MRRMHHAQLRLAVRYALWLLGTAACEQTVPPVPSPVRPQPALDAGAQADRADAAIANERDAHTPQVRAAPRKSKAAPDATGVNGGTALADLLASGQVTKSMEELLAPSPPYPTNVRHVSQPTPPSIWLRVAAQIGCGPLLLVEGPGHWPGRSPGDVVSDGMRVIDEQIKRRVRSIPYCYLGENKTQGPVSGPLVLRFGVVNDLMQDVVVHEDGVGNPDVARCVVDTIKRMRLPGVPGGPKLRFEYTITLPPVPPE
jgi:hypothetical protein